MSWKPGSRESIIKQLSKENLPFDVALLTDVQLKLINRKFHQHHICPYKVALEDNFEEALYAGKLHFTSFKGVKGLRNMTFSEYLSVEEFIRNHSNVYPHFK